MRKLTIADWLTTLPHSSIPAGRQGGFHFWDFLLGVLFTTAVMGFLYYRVRNSGLKALNRERQSFAVRVCIAVCCHDCIGKLLNQACLNTITTTVAQALKDMDSNTLKKVLGQVCLQHRCTPSLQTMPAVACSWSDPHWLYTHAMPLLSGQFAKLGELPRL